MRKLTRGEYEEDRQRCEKAAPETARDASTANNKLERGAGVDALPIPIVVRDLR